MVLNKLLSISNSFLNVSVRTIAPSGDAVGHSNLAKLGPKVEIGSSYRAGFKLEVLGVDVVKYNLG
jgi:hypothetical protein